MKGVQFVVDNKGKKKAVMLDLEEWGELWEDIYDVMVAQSRRSEPTVPWAEIKARIPKKERRRERV